jgi:hypothetical protein
MVVSHFSFCPGILEDRLSARHQEKCGRKGMSIEYRNAALELAEQSVIEGERDMRLVHLADLSHQLIFTSDNPCRGSSTCS